MKPAYPHSPRLVRALLALGLALIAAEAPSRADGQLSFDEADAFASRLHCATALAPVQPKAPAGTPLPDITRSCSILGAATDFRLKEPFRIQAKTGAPSAWLPSRADGFARTVFRTSRSPLPGSVPEGATVTGALEFGYRLPDEYRVVGSLNYAVVAKDGSVLEVGGGSKEVLDELKAHLFGRRRTAEQVAALGRMSRQLIDELRAMPRLKAKLQKFTRERGWPRGLEDRALLAYIDSDPSLEPWLRHWAAEHRYTFDQLREAGWMRLGFSQNGGPRWSMAREDCVVIPFLGADGQGVTSWRIRNMSTRDPDAPKYLSWPKDRASTQGEAPISDQLYNSAALARVRGKPLVITEGEFKALVAQESSGVATVGILGITSWGPSVIQALVQSGASEFVIILDRDPRASGLMRVDGISDSQRAAYSIARALEQAGATAKVGVLPDAFGGKKVGVDDLILARGVDGPGLYRKTIADAAPPAQYARTLGLDPEFQELQRRRREISRKILEYQRSENRGGQRIAGGDFWRARQALNELNRAYEDYLRTHYNGALRLDQPSAAHQSVDRIGSIPGPAGKRIVVGGKQLPLDLFTGDLLVLDESTSDTVARDFPADDYIHDRGVGFFAKDATGAWSETAQVPLVIRKKSTGRAVALVLGKGGTGLPSVRRFLRSDLPAAAPLPAQPAALRPAPRAPPELELGVARVLGDAGAQRFFSGWDAADLNSYRSLIDDLRYHLIEHLRDPARGRRIPRDYFLAVTGQLGELLAQAEFRGRQPPGTTVVPDDGKGNSIVNDRFRPDGIALRTASGGDSVVVTGLLESKVGRSSHFAPAQYNSMLAQWKQQGAFIAGRLRRPEQIAIEIDGVVKPLTAVTPSEFLGIVSVYQPNGTQTISGVRAVISGAVDPKRLRLVGFSVVSAALAPYLPDAFAQDRDRFEDIFRSVPNGVSGQGKLDFEAWKARRLVVSDPIELIQLRLRYQSEVVFAEFLAREKRWPNRRNLTGRSQEEVAAAIAEERFAAVVEGQGGELAYFLSLSRADARAFLDASPWRPTRAQMTELVSKPELVESQKGNYLGRLRALFGFNPA